jgi:uncharacterized protein YceK
MTRMILLLLMLTVLTGCSEFAILMSGSSLALTQNTYAKMYNGIDVLTIMNTDKSIKGHAYDNVKKAWIEVKEGKEYIYDKTWGFTD